VAVAVVHGLEAVQVHHQHCQPLAVLRGARHAGVHGVVQAGAVVQAGEQVRAGQALDAHLGFHQGTARADETGGQPAPQHKARSQGQHHGSTHHYPGALLEGAHFGLGGGQRGQCQFFVGLRQQAGLAAIALAAEQRSGGLVRPGIEGVQRRLPHAGDVSRGAFGLAAVLRGHRRGRQQRGMLHGLAQFVDQAVVAVGPGPVAGEGGRLRGLQQLLFGDAQAAGHLVCGGIALHRGGHGFHGPQPLGQQQGCQQGGAGQRDGHGVARLAHRLFDDGHRGQQGAGRGGAVRHTGGGGTPPGYRAPAPPT
jgi:hypothetical protein